MDAVLNSPPADYAQYGQTIFIVQSFERLHHAPAVERCAVGSSRQEVAGYVDGVPGGSPGGGLTVSGGGWPAGDAIFVQIGSTTFDTDVVCVLAASASGTISGNQAGANCRVPNVPTGSQTLVAIDEQNEGVQATGAGFKVT